MDNETWIIETGDRVIQKEANHGRAALSAWESLVLCLWVVDYSMRNGGSLQEAGEFFGSSLADGAKLAAALALPITRSAFSLSSDEFESKYFELFELICKELRNVEPRLR